VGQQKRRDELRFSQNFLRSTALVARLVALARLDAGATVFEIGPGKGIITRELARAVGPSGSVIAVEADKGLAEALSREFKPVPQVRIEVGDALRFDYGTLPDDFVAVSNVPFNITSLLLERLFDPSHSPSRAYLILQRETLISQTGQGRGETFKSLMLKPFYEIEEVYRFERSDFAPSPSVDTGFFSFVRRSQALIAPVLNGRYKDFLATLAKDRAGEGAWRRVLSPLQLKRLFERSDVVEGRGLKAQAISGIVAAFEAFLARGDARYGTVAGGMDALRAEQQRRDEMNRSGGFRRPKRPR
jgi:23S rRNA (adenine-N6)-dimethyltransferase